jgi:hypothetical protein
MNGLFGWLSLFGLSAWIVFLAFLENRMNAVIRQVTNVLTLPKHGQAPVVSLVAKMRWLSSYVDAVPAEIRPQIARLGRLYEALWFSGVSLIVMYALGLLL